MDTPEPMWTCGRCGRTFASRNQAHTCAPLGDLDAHFARSDLTVRACFELVVAAVRALGPVDVLVEKSRIALHVRMSFAAFMPRQRWLDGHLVLARTAEHARIRKVEVYSPRNVLHAFRLIDPDQVDAGFMALVTQAYQVGQQRHLKGGSNGAASK